MMASEKRQAHDLDHEQASKNVSTLIDFCCFVYRVDYSGLAEMLGLKKGTFTRYRNAEFGEKSYFTTVDLAQLAASVTREQIMSSLLDEGEGGQDA